MRFGFGRSPAASGRPRRRRRTASAIDAVDAAVLVQQPLQQILVQLLPRLRGWLALLLFLFPRGCFRFLAAAAAADFPLNAGVADFLLLIGAADYRLVPGAASFLHFCSFLF